MYKFCPNCGKELPNHEAKFCPHCGYKLSDAEASTASVQSSEQVTQPTSPTQPTSQTTQSSTQPTQAFYQSTQPTQPTGQPRYEQYTATTPGPYNGSGNPGLITSVKLWLQTGFKANQCMGRADYWWGSLGFAIISIILYVLYIATLPSGSSLYYGDVSPLFYVMSIIYYIYSIFFGILSIFVIVQRLHDSGHSGFNWLWSLTGIGAIYVLVLIVQPTNWNKTDFPRNHYNIK